MPKYTEARAKANKKWNKNNKERVQYINKRSAAKSFILNLATKEDLENIKSYIAEREHDLNLTEK
ncbi:hypothetical protein FOF71_09985 [Lactobacillus paragasseri]|uniref:Phage protein n=1 Tax=Lactobacillus paragasseri TaxID=2107999 RepID=A0AAW6XR93_9LACO|nr:hypothetical protein [Lactobacillus paragasseri]MDK6869381.1 hypothetical protein [Lactobacillus paragasseri]TVU98955.1 hypothetical protein FOF71_09985 [Lactobacillus paragasseri]